MGQIALESTRAIKNLTKGNRFLKSNRLIAQPITYPGITRTSGNSKKAKKELAVSCIVKNGSIAILRAPNLLLVKDLQSFHNQEHYKNRFDTRGAEVVPTWICFSTTDRGR